MTIRRVVRAYSNSTERELWSLPIHDFNLEAFQVEFQAEVSDPMYDCWPITQKNLPFLSRHIVNPHGWDFINCTYFIEAEAT